MPERFQHRGHGDSRFIIGKSFYEPLGKKARKYYRSLLTDIMDRTGIHFDIDPKDKFLPEVLLTLKQRFMIGFSNGCQTPEQAIIDDLVKVEKPTNLEELKEAIRKSGIGDGRINMLFKSLVQVASEPLKKELFSFHNQEKHPRQEKENVPPEMKKGKFAKAYGLAYDPPFEIMGNLYKFIDKGSDKEVRNARHLAVVKFFEDGIKDVKSIDELKEKAQGFMKDPNKYVLHYLPKDYEMIRKEFSQKQINTAVWLHAYHLAIGAKNLPLQERYVSMENVEKKLLDILGLGHVIYEPLVRDLFAEMKKSWSGDEEKFPFRQEGHEITTVPLDRTIFITKKNQPLNIREAYKLAKMFLQNEKESNVEKVQQNRQLLRLLLPEIDHSLYKKPISDLEILDIKRSHNQMEIASAIFYQAALIASRKARVNLIPELYFDLEEILKIYSEIIGGNGSQALVNIETLLSLHQIPKFFGSEKESPKPDAKTLIIFESLRIHHSQINRLANRLRLHSFWEFEEKSGKSDVEQEIANLKLLAQQLLNN